jgi:hypothetical protein
MNLCHQVCASVHNGTMQTRKPLISAIFIPVLIGCIGLSNVARQPRFQALHNVDALQLIASGMCFGIALSSLLMLIFGRRKL